MKEVLIMVKKELKRERERKKETEKKKDSEAKTTKYHSQYDLR